MVLLDLFLQFLHFLGFVIQLGRHVGDLLALTGAHLLHLGVDLSLSLLQLFIFLFQVDEAATQGFNRGRLCVSLAKLVVFDDLVEEFGEFAVCRQLIPLHFQVFLAPLDGLLQLLDGLSVEVHFLLFFLEFVLSFFAEDLLSERFVDVLVHFGNGFGLFLLEFTGLLV